MHAASLEAIWVTRPEAVDLQRIKCLADSALSYATHLLEAGVNLRLIQKYLGHSSLQATTIYLHLTSLGQEQARATIEALMSE
jgi:integrase